MISRCLLVLAWILCHQAMAIDFPAKPDPPRLVNDYTGTLSEAEKQSLENKLVIFNDTTSIQIAVVIMKTLDGYPLSDYAFELAQKWGIGQRETNNGVLLLVSMEERKLFIATGYSMEGMMPDALTRQIVSNDIMPYFKEGRYYEGIDNGTTQIILLAKGEYRGKEKKQDNFPGIGVAGILIFIIFMLLLFRIRSVRNMASLNEIPFWIAWQLLTSGRNRHRGKWTDFNSGRGGFGGFGGGGFGGGGGGFGGFGGGSFGGGGAGGSW